MESPLLQVKNLTTSLQFGKNSYPVVNNLSFDLKKGKTLALVGESGCGKSLTALSLLRILPQPPALPSTGEVIYQGQNLLTVSEKEMRKIRGSKISMIFQDPTSALNPVYTVGNQLMEVAELHLNLWGEEAYEKVIDALKEASIPSPEDRFHAYPHQLSGGMRQRIMIAMALMCQPDVLIADEPTTALDVTIQAQILDLIRHLQKKNGMAALLITHDMGIVAEIADDVIVMYASEGVEKADSFTLFDKMAHPYTQELFASRPSNHAPKTMLHSIKGFVPSPQNFPTGCHFHPRCPFSMPICQQGAVPQFTIDNNPLHTAKCWLFDPNLDRRANLGNEDPFKTTIETKQSKQQGANDNPA